MNDCIGRFILLICISILYAPNAWGQMYYQEGRQVCCGEDILKGNHRALGINPANLGMADRSISSIGFFQMGGNFYSNQLNLTQLFDISLTGDALDQDVLDQLTTLSTKSTFSYHANLESAWLSASFASPRFGGLAVSLRDRVNSYSSVPHDMLGLMLLGRNSPVYQNATHILDLQYIGDGTNMLYSHLREAHVGYGREVIRNETFSLALGASLKKLWGVGYFRSSIADGFVTGLSSFSTFYNINYGSLQQVNQGFRRKLLNSSGSGYSYDLGAGLTISTVNLGISVLDIGKVTWRDQTIASQTPYLDFVNTLNEEGVIGTSSFQNEIGDIYDSFSFQNSGNFDVYLNTVMRLNSSVPLTENLGASSDVIIPLRDNSVEVLNYHPAIYAFGLNYQILLTDNGGFNLSSAFFYSEQYGVRVPFGISASLGRTATFSVSTTDVLTFVFNRQTPFPGLSITGLTLLF